MCGVGPSDLDHVTTRGAGGKDIPENLIPLCRVHHVERHSTGWGHMIRKYIGVKKWMERNGRDDIFEKIKR